MPVIWAISHGTLVTLNFTLGVRAAYRYLLEAAQGPQIASAPARDLANVVTPTSLAIPQVVAAALVAARWCSASSCRRDGRDRGAEAAAMFAGRLREKPQGRGFRA